jgi:glutamyl-tRNA reductase
VLLVVGLNYQESHIEIREKYAPGDLIHTFTQSILSLQWVAEVFVLSTCNRTEIYCLLSPDLGYDLESPEPETFVHFQKQLVQIWQKSLDIPQILNSSGAIDGPKTMFYLWGKECLKHLTKVAAGLEAMILGEPQILGQVKASVRDAVDWGCVGPGFQKILNPVFELAKLVRSSTDIGRCPVTFASATYQLASQIFSNLEECHVLFIGAGEMIELVCRHFFHQRTSQLSVANRTLARTDRFVSDFGAKPYRLEDIPNLMPSVDIVVSCTGSPHRVLESDVVKKALSKRRQKPIFLADLAVPRDICESVSDLENAFLYTVDDIHQVLDSYKGKRVDAAESAYNIINDGVDQIITQHRVQALSPLIKEYRQDCEAMRLQALAESRRQLMRGDDPFAVLEILSRSLTKRLMHKPTKGLRSLAASGDSSQVNVVKEAFGIVKQDH